MKIRIIGFVFWVFSICTASAQVLVSKTDMLKIYGNIASPISFTLSQLDTFQKTKISDLIIYNSSGEIKDTLTKMRGIPLQNLFSSFQFLNSKPKDLNEYYFVFTASDSYKVVFSWNEIFNSECGNNFYLLTELEGGKLMEMEQRIVFISTRDIKSGRRYIKGLESIEVRQID